MTSTTRPYFIWDYDLTDEDVRRILHGTNDVEKEWMFGRILTSARFEDIWSYVTLKDVVDMFPKLRMRPVVKRAWQRALNVWGYDV